MSRVVHAKEATMTVAQRAVGLWSLNTMTRAVGSE